MMAEGLETASSFVHEPPWPHGTPSSARRTRGSTASTSPWPSASRWRRRWSRRTTTDNYGEQRFRSIGPIGNKLFVYVFTSDEDDTERAISLREADARERRHYVDNI